jgi:hypothetical protein
MKIVGVGLPKTGTKTLRECCTIWGLRHQSLAPDCFELLLAQKTDQILKRVEESDSFEDTPWYLLYREIDERFPDSKFILTKRKSPAVWFGSYCKWAARFRPEFAFRVREYVFGGKEPCEHEVKYVEKYLAHNEAVRRYFMEKPGHLLEVCWEGGDGWAQLASFLGFDVPACAFPHRNRSSRNEVDIEIK